MRLPVIATMLALVSSTSTGAQNAVTFPPKLPGDKEVVTDTSEEFLKPTSTFREGVLIAKTPPIVDFAFFPGQDYAGKPWSAWGDSLAANGNYYAAIGDHLAPAGNGFIYEYDPESKKFRRLVDVRKLLNLPEGHYTPGKIHSRLDLGKDGWLYFSTHRGSTNVTTDRYHYKGDWIIRVHPADAKAEIVAHGPVPKHCIPTSVLDPERLIFYGGTTPGTGADEGQFFAYDVTNRKLLCTADNGPSRYLMFARSTGRVYYTEGKDDAGRLMRFDPSKGGPPQPIPGTLGIRAATQETPQGLIYTVSTGQRNADASLWSFNTKTETIENLGPAAVGQQTYITTLDADPTGRYLYYMPGAHGRSPIDGTPVVQFDVKTRKKRVVAFLHPFYEKKYGVALEGTYSAAVDPKGDKLYITWNARRGAKVWDCCALTVIHLPEAERRP